MDIYGFVKRIASNLLMLEDFSVLNTSAQVRQITGFITRTCAGFVDIDSKLVEDAVSAAVQDNEIEGMIFPELLEEEGHERRITEQHRERRANRYRRQREIAQARANSEIIDPYEALKF